MIRSMAGLTVRVTINTLFYEGSGRRAELTPFTMPIPTITMTPTVIQRAGTCAKCAPIARPIIRMQNPTIYKPKDIRHPAGTKHVAGRLCAIGLQACRCLTRLVSSGNRKRQGRKITGLPAWWQAEACPIGSRSRCRAKPKSGRYQVRAQSALDRKNRVERCPGPSPFHLCKARLPQQPLILA